MSDEPWKFLAYTVMHWSYFFFPLTHHYVNGQYSPGRLAVTSSILNPWPVRSSITAPKTRGQLTTPLQSISLNQGQLTAQLRPPLTAQGRNNTANPFVMSVKLKSEKNLICTLLSWWIIMKSCTNHGNVIAMLYAKFCNDMLTKICDDIWDFELKMKFEWICTHFASTSSTSRSQPLND